MTGKQLKNSILQWAIQGKLVPQDPNDEPASVLLEKIRVEKARLIKEGKIKKDKNESIIYRGDDNSYYEKLADGKVICIDGELPISSIPSGWCWCKINNIAFVTKLAGFEYTEYIANNIGTSGVPLFKGKNVQNGQIIYDFEAFIPEVISDALERSQITKKCLLTPYVGTIGNIGIHSKEGKYHLGSNVGKIEILNPSNANLIIEEYIHFYLQSCFGYDELTKHKKATAQESISIEAIRDVYVAVPPQKEQIRIVEKIEQVLMSVQKYDTVQRKLNVLNANIFANLKKSFLQEAIKGKLVAQDPNDEPTSVLLKRISIEKEKLVSEGKLKKGVVIQPSIFKGDDNKYYEQIGSECIDISDEIAFDLPCSWMWARGKAIFTPMESAKPESDYFVYIDVDAVNNKKNIIDKPKKILLSNAPSRASRKLHINDTLFSMVRPYLKNIAYVDERFKNAIASTGFYVITPSNALFPKFLFYLMLTPYVVDGLNKFMKGDNSPSINNFDIENYLYPIPPYNEQERIAKKIEELYARL